MRHYDFASALKQTGALWVAPAIKDVGSHSVHAELTSGRHSDGFVNLSMLLTDPVELSKACGYLVRNAIAMHGNLPVTNPLVADWVVGSAIGGITIAHEIARWLDARVAFTEKEDGEMKLLRFVIPRGAYVLVVEDVMTTGGTCAKTTAELLKLGCKVVPLILTTTNRRQIRTLDVSGQDTAVCSLELDVTFNDWAPEDCPHCARGSTALRPKEKANWARFMQS